MQTADDGGSSYGASRRRRTLGLAAGALRLEVDLRSEGAQTTGAVIVLVPGGVTPGGAGMRSWGRGASGGRTRSWAAGVSQPMISRDVRRLGELVCVAGKEVRGWLGSGME